MVNYPHLVTIPTDILNNNCCKKCVRCILLGKIRLFNYMFLYIGTSKQLAEYVEI